MIRRGIGGWHADGGRRYLRLVTARVRVRVRVRGRGSLVTCQVELQQGEPGAARSQPRSPSHVGPTVSPSRRVIAAGAALLRAAFRGILPEGLQAVPGWSKAVR